ncbi:HEPN domain-containing protein [archaeon]|nr:HEPN domain-containing protein [archaeon]
MNAENIIKNALKRRSKGERGLKVMDPNPDLSSGHIKKADHNLVVMTDLKKLGHEDWVVISAYYAVYQSALALLTKVGLESKEHATTVSVLEYFFGNRINKGLIERFNDLKERKDRIEAVMIQEKYIDYMWHAKGAREAVQYGISINYKEADLIMSNAREFVVKMKLVLSELDDILVESICRSVKEMEK